MPTYEYECESCGVHFDRRERFAAEPLKTCPECNSPVHRVIQPVGIIFKGSGWYCKDSSSSSSLTSTPKSEESEKKAEKTESKSEAKASSSADEKVGGV